MRCFLQWFLLLLSYIVIAFFSFRYGLPQLVFKTDFTYITSIIGVIFVMSVGYLGFASWRWDNDPDDEDRIMKARAACSLGRTLYFVVTLFGLLGTAIGLMFQIQALGSLDPTQVSAVSHVIANISSSLGTALYATCTGIVAAIGLILMNANLEYHLDQEDDE